MVFTMNGVKSERIYGAEKNGYLVFTYTNIAPHFMGDNISAVLYDEDGAQCSSLDSFSVKEYAEKIESFSILAGYIGMNVATKANVRTANAARESGSKKKNTRI